MKNKAFTLIELLVVISIIALLMAMLMPAAARVKTQAKTIVCQGNLKQWGLATTMYTGDHNGNFWVGSNDWWNYMFPYIKSEEIFVCTTATKTAIDGARRPFVASERVMDDLGRQIKMSYAMTQYVTYPRPTVVTDNPVHAARFWGTSNVKKGSNIPIVVGSSRMTTLSPFASETDQDEPPAYEGDVIFGSGSAMGELKRICVNRHNGYVNISFMDGSARKVGLKELWILKWHRTFDPYATLPPVWPRWMRNFKDYR